MSRQKELAARSVTWPTLLMSTVRGRGTQVVWSKSFFPRLPPYRW